MISVILKILKLWCSPTLPCDLFQDLSDLKATKQPIYLIISDLRDLENYDVPLLCPLNYFKDLSDLKDLKT